MTIQITVGNKVFKADIEASETGKAFIAKLPLTLDMSELNGNEKYHYLMNALPSVPERVEHIEAGDITLIWDSCVVVFYQSFNMPCAHTHIGRIISTEFLGKSRAPVIRT